MPDGGFSKRKRSGPSRNSVRDLTEAQINSALHGAFPPSLKLMLRAFYGPEYAAIMARTHGIKRDTVYRVNSSSRIYFERMLAGWENPKLRRQWEEHELSKLERRREFRAACARWCRLILADMDKS